MVFVTLFCYVYKFLVRFDLSSVKGTDGTDVLGSRKPLRLSSNFDFEL